MTQQDHECMQGFNATITAQVEGPRRRGPDQIMEMNLQLHPGMRDSLATLCADPNTILVILSGSERTVLDEVCSLYLLICKKPIRIIFTYTSWEKEYFGKLSLSYSFITCSCESLINS
jgi:hypothetical protein